MLRRLPLPRPRACPRAPTPSAPHEHSYRSYRSSLQTRRLSSSRWLGLAPTWTRPYILLARLDKPAGTLLLFWPCVWGAALAAPLGQLPDPRLCLTFALGALVMRGAGCTINDMWDRDIDAHVARTRDRPLASGALSMPRATVFLAGQLLVGLGVLLSLNTYSIALGMASVPLVVAYPLMKRFSDYPQLVLGLAFNWGALVGWSASLGTLSWEVLPLYASGVCWTLVYDTLYGYQDKQDDLKLGMRSTAITFGDKPQLVLTLLGSGMVGGLACAGAATGLSAPFYAGVGAVGAHLLWQIWTADLEDQANLWLRFKSNSAVGGAVALAIVLGHF